MSLYDVNITCPFCFESFTVEVDISGGEEQEWDYDCEVCCHAMTISATWDSNDERFEATAVKAF